MSKYIIDLRPDCKVVQQICESDGQVSIGAKSIEYLEELNADYVNEHFGSLQDEAYHRGLEEGKKAFDLLDAERDAEYQRGLDDAWEAARKIADMWTRIDNDELLAIFGITERIGYSTIKALFEKQTANEAMLELEAYEEKQKAEDEIKVGDEVIYNGTMKCLVVRPETDERYALLIDGNGHHHSADHRECKKTGRHFDIAKILEAMKND